MTKAAGLRNNQSGNIAILTGLMIFVIFVLGGAGVDMVRFATIRAELQSATDSAVLAASSLSNQQSPTAVATEYFNTNFKPERFSLDPSAVSFTPVLLINSGSSRQVRATANVEMPTLFIKFLNQLSSNDFSTFSIEVAASAGERFNEIEVAMVLDVSTSMNGPRIDNLRAAGQAFVDQLFTSSEDGQLSISIIPFSDNVNLEPIVTDYVSLADAAVPITRPCIFYENDDYDGGPIIGDRELVDQSNPGGLATTTRDRCTDTPVFLNSDNDSELKNVIDGFTAFGRTDAHIGLAWGLRALSPDYQGDLGGDFNDRPSAYSPDTTKALVMMSDGNINPIPNPDGSVPNAQSEAQFFAMCEEARNNDILVYTVGFQIAPGSQADILLRDCASNLSQYFLVETLDLQSAFSGIAASINRLSISE